MAVSKRTRYEVLKRDSFTCRYCGASAPDVKLHVDHVTPVALGGSDEPSNLTTACRDCNAGKSSTAPDAATVADIDAKAARWTAARRLALKEFKASRKEVTRAQAGVLDNWQRWDPDCLHLASNFDSTIESWMKQGLTAEDVLECYFLATGHPNLAAARVWRYMCGIARNRVADIDRRTQQILDVGGE